MSKKKQKRKHSGPPKPLVQLSQCMIVKNEEKNIEKALAWAKPIAFEQIVVDTGSTDRTIELAERMGAKVLHFEWVNDFSAAKNFAIEQAVGNWVAFLDADEYLSPEDAKHLLYCLKQIQSDPEARHRWKALNFPWAHVDENGVPFAIQDQERVFKSFVRYTGRIHERLNIDVNDIAHIDEITIIHTGYSAGALSQTQKAERNITMLRDVLNDNPGDGDSKVFLADSLQATNNPENIAEAEMLFYEAIRGDMGGVLPALKRKSYLRLISKYDEMPTKLMSREELCLKALLEFDNDVDFCYFHGETLNASGNFREAWNVLSKCEQLTKNRDAMTDSEIISARPELLYEQLVIAAKGLDYSEDSARYMSLIEEMTR